MLGQAVQNVDGNEIAAIRLPELTAPLATYTGWALRAGPQANDLPALRDTGAMLGG
jgi:hypothetical protein